MSKTASSPSPSLSPPIKARRRQSALPRPRLSSLGVLRPALIPLFLLACWYVVTHTGLVAPLFLPKPEEVAKSAWQDREALLKGLGVSMRMITIGFVLGSALGLFVGLLFAFSRMASQLFEFTVDALRPVPLFALIPLFILWFGIGMTPQIAIVGLGAFLIISLTTVEAVRNVPSIYLRAAAVSGASRVQVYRTIVLPAILPHMMGGIRLAIAAAWGLDVAAEYTGSQDGLGYLMVVREQYLDTAGIIAIVFIFAILAIVADRLVQRIARRLTRWTDRTAKADPLSSIP